MDCWLLVEQRQNIKVIKTLDKIITIKYDMHYMKNYQEEDERMSKNIKEQLNEYYDEAFEKLVNKSEADVKVLKLGIAVTFIQSYMQSVFQAISISINSKDQTGAALVLGTAEKISDGMGKIDKDSSIDDKIAALINVLENVNTPAYDILKIADINIPLIETIKSDFSIIAEFLKK